MKILYIGVYKDGTGWGHAACEYITALHNSGADVVIRHIKLNDINYSTPNFFYELEQKDLNNIDICIQHLLPEHMEYTSRCKSVGLYSSETDNVSHSGWADHINLMDGILLMSNDAHYSALRSKVRIPTYVIGMPTDTSKYSKIYEPLPIDGLQDNFNFYFIGEFTPRKNLGALLTAFHTEFHVSEHVNLVIKTSNDFNSVNDFCTKVKNGLKLYPTEGHYKKEYIITQYLSDEEIMRLHATCDCFVMPSYGEDWDIPAFEAMGMGKTPIVSNIGGMRDYITNKTGWLISGNKQPAFGTFSSPPNLHTARENWFGVNINHLRKNMRQAYENKGLRQTKSYAGQKRIQDFSYKNVGKRMLECLTKI